ncbi:MAG: Fur family transcriptional regulator [Actinomycetota bacterium]|nr:Fur family transcriptional regulator [Actinomycetota bacterium]
MRGVTDELRDTVTRRLHEQQQRMTPVRSRLLDVLAATHRPLTITEILEHQRDLAQSSVYRNLVVLEQAGVVHRVVTHDEFARYELTEALTGHHHHLVCSNCGRVDDLPASDRLERSVADAVADAAEKIGFRTMHHRLDLVGLCTDCA